MIAHLKKLQSEGNGMKKPINAFIAALVNYCLENNKNPAVYLALIVEPLLEDK